MKRCFQIFLKKRKLFTWGVQFQQINKIHQHISPNLGEGGELAFYFVEIFHFVGIQFSYCNKFGKKAVQNLPTRIHFFKKSRDQVDKVIDQLYLSKSIPVYVLNPYHVMKCIVVSNFKYRSVKMLLLKLGSELPNLVKTFQFVLKIWEKCRLNFHEVEFVHEVKFTGNNFTNSRNFS